MKKNRVASLAVVGLTLGLVSYLGVGLGNNQVEVRADSFNEVETAAFVHMSGQAESTDAHIIICLADNDYGSNVTYNYNTDKVKFDALNLANYIKINDEPVNFDTFNSQGFKLGTEIHTGLLAPAGQTISIRINFNNKTTSDITSYSLVKGCQLPSNAYMDNGTGNVYTICGDLTSTRAANQNYGWLNVMDTDVYAVHTVDNTYLGISTTANDYPNTFADGNLSTTDTNFHTNVTLNDGAISVVNGYGLFAHNNINKSIWLQTGVKSTNVNKVHIAEGTILPSYHRIKTSPAWPLYLRCTTERTFERNATGEFAPIFEKVDTSVETINFTSINGEWLSFKLTNNDYSTSKQARFPESAQYNFWSKINLVDTSDVSHPLGDVVRSFSHIFNFNNAHPGETSVNLQSGYVRDAGTIKKIIIPAGTEFPEFAYLNKSSTGRPKAYVTTEDVEFQFGTNKIFAKVVETEITAMRYFANGYLGFALSENDYPTTFTEKWMEQAFTNCNTMVDSSGIGITFKHVYSLWSYDNFVGSVAYQVQGTIQQGFVIIPAGTLFPSFEFSNNTSLATPIVYKVAAAQKFLYNGTEFVDFSTPNYINNTIVGLETHGTAGSNDFAIDIAMSVNDWPTTITNFDMINGASHADRSYKTNYNTFDKIRAYAADGTQLVITNEFFVNVWGATNRLSFRLHNASVNQALLSYVVVDEGVELPTYAGFYVDYGNNEYGDNSRYLINQGNVFMYNAAQGTFSKSNFYENNTSITAVNELEGESQDSLISFSLGNNDYLSNLTVSGEYRERLNLSNLADYITINGISLADLGYSTGDIFISSDGKISFRTPGNNTGYYYINQGNRLYTGDLTKYEVRIAEGCQFPSLEYLTGATSLPTCYVTTVDYDFVWLNGEYVPYDSNLVVNNLNIEKIDFNGGLVYLTLSGTDWLTSVSGNINQTIACRDFLSHIEVVDTDGNIHLPSTTEVLVNNRSGDKVTIAFRIDIASASSIKKAIFYEGCLIPTYDQYLNGADSWYMLRAKEAHYSSKDGAFYLGTGLDEIGFAREFNAGFAEICGGYDGITNNHDALENKFYAFKNIYDEELSADVKTRLGTSQDSEVLQMREAYSYAVVKYGLDAFMVASVGTMPIIGSLFNTQGSASKSDLALVVIGISIAVSIASCVMIRKTLSRRHEKE